jgi:hypothetical protein
MELEIKKWYLENYANDELGEELKDNITFNDLFYALDRYENIYELLGSADSIIRERVFQKLAELMQVDYDYIYNQWMLA